MDFELKTAELKELYVTGKGSYPASAIKGFFKRMATIKSAKDERDLRNVKGARFEKLKGDRAGEHSMRLDDVWRLILELEGEAPDVIVSVKEITNHYA